MGQLVITVAQQKGGAGKTTIAAHLAVAFVKMGWRVALVDVDPQGSLSRWHEIREERMSKGNTGINFVETSGWRVASEVARLRQNNEIIIIDSPPHIKTEARSAIRCSDMILVPIQPSPTDLWATEATLNLAREERRKTRIIMNRVNPKSRIFHAIQNQIGSSVANIICNRVIFASSMMEGLGVTEKAPNSVAAYEIITLANNVIKSATNLTMDIIEVDNSNGINAGRSFASSSYYSQENEESLA